MIPKRIVGEVSVNWVPQHPQEEGILSQKFEFLTAVNAERGYDLESWQLSRVVHQSPSGDYQMMINETIIAVFVKVEATDDER